MELALAAAWIEAHTTPPPEPEPEPPADPTPNTGPPVETGIVQLIRDTWPDDPDRAVRIARCESNLDPAAIGRAGELGLMQLHPTYHRHRWTARGWSDAHMLTPAKNLQIAREIHATAGWTPWACQ